MTNRVILFCVTCIVALQAVTALAEPSITITDIQSNGKIEGSVSGLDAETDAYCVVVYVHTDMWYIHPYASGGRGRSWAEIKGSSWTISTVRREFPADSVAAVVLKRESKGGNCPAPPKLETVNGMDRQVGRPFIKPLSEGDAWYGKL